MTLRLASSLFTLSLVSTLCPFIAHAESPVAAVPAAESLAPPSPPSLPIGPSTTSFRLGVDGSVGIGAIAYASVGLRTELALSRETFFLAGLAYLNGAPMDGAGFQGGVTTLGVRRYSNWVYAGLEAGVLAMRTDPYLPDFEDEIEPSKWGAVPMVRGTFGTKIGPVDLGISVTAPFVTAGLSLGFDLATFSEPRRSKARKARPPVAVRTPSSQQ